MKKYKLTQPILLREFFRIGPNSILVSAISRNASSTIFIAICHAVFANRFSGRAGKGMATAFGIGLGIALTLAEVQFGWNLTAAGPYALIIILLLLGFLLFHVQMAVHIPWQIALPLTYVLMYALLRALSPALSRTLADKLPFINLLTAFVFLFAVWQLGLEIWHRFESVTARHSSGTGFISGLNRATEKRALKVEKRINGCEKQTLTPTSTGSPTPPAMELDRPPQCIDQHPNEAAHRIIADEIVSAIREDLP